MIDYRMNWNEKAENAVHGMMEEAYGRLVEEREQGIAGYYNLPEDAPLIVEEVEAIAASRESWKNAETIVVIGIGGSSLGAKAVDQALRPLQTGLKRIVFLENPDTLEVRAKFAAIDPEKSLFIVISKSGGTIETTSIFKLAIAHFGLEVDGKDRERIVVITDEGSILYRYAQKHGLESYLIPANVGGRFSVLSAVGIVPLTLAGFDTRALLAGARKMVDGFFARQEDHLLRKGAFLASHWRQYRMNVLFAYGTYLEDLTKWYVQLWGESLGKIDAFGNRVGLTPMGHIGSVDQHSFLQLIIEGPRDKTVSFLKVESFGEELEIPRISLDFIEKNDYINGHTLHDLLKGECDATMESIRDQGVPTDAIVMDRLDAENIGELILYYELLTSVVGAMLHIDTYNQPGVELGKKILVKKFQDKGSENA